LDQLSCSAFPVASSHQSLKRLHQNSRNSTQARRTRITGRDWPDMWAYRTSTRRRHHASPVSACFS
jgi:hypothetical protein